MNTSEARELGKTPEMEDKYGAIIPPEDQMFCNNAEGCDNCKWNVVCFKEANDESDR